MRQAAAVVAMAMAVVSGEALAFDLTVHNCMEETLRVVTFDEDDRVTMIPHAEYEIPGRNATIVQCVGRTKCQIRVFYGHQGEEFETGETLYVRRSSLIGIYPGYSCES